MNSSGNNKNSKNKELLRKNNDDLKNNLKDRIINKLKDMIDILNKKVDRMLDEINNKLDFIFDKLQSNLDDGGYNLKNLKQNIFNSLSDIRSNFNRKTTEGTIIIENLHNRTMKISEYAKNIKSPNDKFEIEQLLQNLIKYSDILLIFRENIDQISYRKIGLTIMGLILTVFPPPIGIFSLVIGLLLLLNKDLRAKLSGLIMILATFVSFWYFFFFL